MPDSTAIYTAQPPHLSLDRSLFPEGTHEAAGAGLTVGGCSLRRLAADYGTPALIVDEVAMRDRAAQFVRA